jgi:hypothetical protein
VLPHRAFRPAPIRALAIFYRFTGEETIDDSNRAYTTLDHRKWSS